MSADYPRFKIFVVCVAVLAGLSLPVATVGAGVSVGLTSRRLRPTFGPSGGATADRL